MYACASSPSVSQPSQPMVFQAASLSGPVTIIALFIGSRVRCWPGRPAVNPSVQRSTYGARTSPAAVRARPAEIAVTESPRQQDAGAGHRLGQPGDQAGGLDPGTVRVKQGPGGPGTT